MTSIAILVRSSLAAWIVALSGIIFAIWADLGSNPRDEVGAGLVGMIVLGGIALCVVSAAIGFVLALIASRRAPESRSADVALGLNVVTFLGVLLSALILFF